MTDERGRFLPVLPESAPFTPEQRAYLNGFFAGLFSRATAPGSAGTPPATPGKSLQPLAILFGSQTGNAEALAKRIGKEAGKRGFAAAVHDLASYPPSQLASEQNLLLVTSTYGDGEPPDNAEAFWQFLCADTAPKLAQLKFSLLALGDSNYPKFCQCGKDFDRRLEELGAQRAHPRVDCDVDFEAPFSKWLGGALTALSECSVASVTTGGSATPAPSTIVPKAEYSRSNPFPATLVTNRLLNGPGSAKETRHFEINLGGAGIDYEIGDALGVIPTNCPELVEEIVRALNCSGDEGVTGPDKNFISFRDALLRHYEITKIPRPFLESIATKSGDALLKKLTSPSVNGELAQFLWGREIIDLLLACPGAKFSPAEFVGLLKKLQPRLYSISSSPKAHPGQVHLTVSVVRYQSLGRKRKGVCSTFMAGSASDEPIPVFVHTSKHFRPPADPVTPMVMVGAGTGVAPFRAFLQERGAIGANGKTWLIFGDQHAATDFLYREELETMQRDRILTRLDTAFSRDQSQKVYVQHRMIEHARELFAWLEDGAHFYVCGDAARMAKDVHEALHQVVERGGGRSREQASEYVARLQRDKRYQRDVY